MRILVVDDNQDSAISMTLLLELQGHEVHVAHAGQTALRVASDKRPDVILLDIGMPGMNGYEVARQLRAQDEVRRYAARRDHRLRPRIATSSRRSPRVSTITW